MRKMEMPNCATIKDFLSELFPPVKENPFFKTPIICVPDKTKAGYIPAKKLTASVNIINAMIGTGWIRIAEVKCFPVISLKYGIKNTLSKNARAAAKKVITDDSLIN